MSRRRRPPVVSKTDANHAEIVQAFRALGWSVCDLANVGGGVPDLIVGGVRDGKRVNVLVEIKTASGALADNQTAWHEAWRGEVVVVRCVEDVMRVCGQEARR